MVKGVGYFTIFFSEFHSTIRKYELSSQMTWLRKTLVQNGNEKRKEILYSKIDDPKRKQQIEFQSENWKLFGIGSPYDYMILEQGDASDKPTGFIKVVRKSRANVSGFMSKSVTARDEDWIYYARRDSQ